MASEIQVQTISGPPTGANANKVIIPAGQTLSVADGLPADAMPADSVVQVLSQDFGSITFQNTLVAGSQISNGVITITPRFSNSKMLVHASLTNEIGQDGGTHSASTYYFSRLYRGGYSGVQGVEIDNASGHQFSRQARQHASGTWYDTPGTTNPVTYGLYCSGGSNLGGVRWIMYNVMITVMEIKQ